MEGIELRIATIEDETKLHELVDMINTVYSNSEGNIWISNHLRISPQRLIEIIRDSELLLATKEDSLLGCIHLERMNDSSFKFKMLVANPAYKGKGIGSLLVKYAEQQAKQLGASLMQLELLVPTDFIHTDKVFLHNWYTRIGYKKVAQHDVDYVHKGISKFLKTGCVAEVYHKNLV